MIATIDTDDAVRCSVSSPLGTLTLVAGRSGLRAVLWPGDRRLDAFAAARPGDSAVIRRAAAQLDEYFAGDRTSFDVELDPQGTEFQVRAWRALTTIPFGETVSYGEQARRMGDSGKARAVGAANGRNPLSIIVPCHRVVGANGSLTGFAGGLDAKTWLLAHEAGIRAADSRGH